MTLTGKENETSVEDGEDEREWERVDDFDRPEEWERISTDDLPEPEEEYPIPHPDELTEERVHEPQS